MKIFGEYLYDEYKARENQVENLYGKIANQKMLYKNTARLSQNNKTNLNWKNNVKQISLHLEMEIATMSLSKHKYHLYRRTDLRATNALKRDGLLTQTEPYLI